MKLSFHGANRDVTGSCHMVEASGKRILIDCGLFQGSRELDEENTADFGFDPREIDMVLLTHAHLDHCGRLPLLVKRGFSGEIISTAATAELARLVMVDSAHLQEEDARFAAKKRRHHEARPPLYTILDALNATSLFSRPARYGQHVELAPGLTATFSDAGHILGSASILLQQKGGASVLFSGDLGKRENLLLAGPSQPPRADAVVMETTYGDRDHRSLDPSIGEFYAAVASAFQRGGNVVVPTFALERAQELLFVIAKGLEQNLLPRHTRVYLDSPMAISVTEIMERNLALLQPDIAKAIRKGHDPFHFEGLSFTRERKHSQAINEVKSGAIIMAGSGMATGGRVRHHLFTNLARPESAVVFVGYAAGGTPARRIIDGAKEIGIFGERIPVKASVHTINGFSAHAGRGDLLAWHAHTGAARTFLVHGEEASMQSFAQALHGTKIDMPTKGAAYSL
ncbi:metallo-beta-lactamase family protein [Rhizomicrobium palustre]|uniref:Metallo-beta-lactamase family protein n=1 Tax=Rhizomicrobium palustre TaxID=189966 RepID=A0A846MW69_9PROT|nr:MBL fold metallo-hydrolase [Rhizomicrobium palustre]NIK87322.1 metallo-beta-lactamase family protein [Rhizomicrobium palustre]